MESTPNKTKYIVSTKDGPVCGYIEQKNGKSYYNFKGIPYAKPPIGKLRFRPPLPIQPWTETIDCTKAKPKPISYNLKQEVVGSEDCLYLDIATPNIKSEKPLPVMFWICCYGFSFTLDEYFEPSMILDEDVIFVKCGFRLGAFGFLSVNDFMAPGNCGLKDIVLALRWLKNNIEEFGGDANNVTLFGSSSGGAAVHLLMLSPMASGLFHKAIIQSASALNYWSLTKNPIQPTSELARQMGITKTSMIDVVEELRAAPAEKIVEITEVLEKKMFQNNETYFMDPVFKPCIEQEFEGQPAFLTKSPPLILKSGNFNKVPLIIGSNNIEASLLQFLKEDFYNDFEKYNNNPELIVPRSLSVDTNISKCIAQKLLKFYLDGEVALKKHTRTQYLQLISDYYFLYYVNKTVQLHSQHAQQCPVYYYVFCHCGEWYVPEDLKFFNSMGHCAELPYIFGLKMPEMTDTYKGSRDSIRTRKRVIKMWTNFSKLGNPTPDVEDKLLQIVWDPVENKDKLNYLCISSELTKGRNPFQERMEFWDELHKEHVFLRVQVHFNDMGVKW